MADKTCVICGGTESEGDVLLEAPCREHWVCTDDIGSFFQRATESESLFPPKCCEQMFILDEYEEHVPFVVAWQYRVKEQGEYAILAKFRVYCGDPNCNKFLHPSSHITDDAAGITYAICEGEACGKITCIGCRVLLDNGIAGHVCKKDENEEAFKQEISAKGYQLCSICNTTIELIEACNHITCECGHDFCYVCGKEWLGLHACPHYGPPKYDSDGYNQDGYHRDTGLNSEGLTRRQDLARRRGENPDEMDEDEDIREEDDPDWEVLQHLSADQRRAVNALPEETRDEALDGLRIELFETRGLVFGPGPEADEQNEDEDLEEDEEDNERKADDLDELFTILEPMIDRLPELPIGLPNFPQAMRQALADSTPLSVQELLALLDEAYDPATHTLTVDFDRERIRSVAQELVDRAVMIGDRDPDLDVMERLLLAVLPHVIIRAKSQQEAESDDGAAEQADADHDDLYAGPDDGPFLVPTPHEGFDNLASRSEVLERADNRPASTSATRQEMVDERNDHDELYAHPDDVDMDAGAFLHLPEDNDSSSADGASPQTPLEAMEDIQRPDPKTNHGEAAVKIQGPPGGWPEVDEDMD